MQTTAHEIAQADGWQEVATAPSNVLVQLRSTGRVEIAVATSAPSSADTPLGVLLSTGGATEFAATSFGGSDNVYVRTLGAGQSETIVVLEDGS